MPTQHPRLRKAFSEASHKAKLANQETGTVGKPNGTISIAGKPHLIWVTTARGNTIKAINAGVPATFDYPCILERNRDNDWVAMMGDGARAAIFTGSSSGGIGIGPHSHRLGFGLEDYVEALRIEEGLVHPTDPASLSVFIEPFPYTYNNVDSYYPGGSIDLTSNRPATANSWAWVKVGINPATNLAVATTGTEQLKSVPLTASQLAAVTFTGYLPLMGIKLRNAQSSIANIADFLSWRLALGLVTTTYYQTIRDAGTPETQRSALNLLAGVGITRTVADDAGNNETEDTVAIAETYKARRLNVNTTTVGNVGAGEDDLMSYTLPAAVLANNGEAIEFKRGGTFAASANNKQLRIKYGATTIFDTGVLAITSASDWYAEGMIIRTGATTQKAIVTFRCSDVLVTVATDYTTPGETLSGTVVLKATGEATSDNDIVEELCTIDWRPNA